MTGTLLLNLVMEGVLNRRQIIAGLVAAPLIGCTRSLPTYRFRLSVHVDTPQGEQTGTSVIEVHTVDQGKGFPGPEAGGIRISFRGEAASLKMPNGVYVFAMLRGKETHSAQTIASAPFAATRAPVIAGESYDDRLGRVMGVAGAHELPLSSYPQFVYFENISDPASVQEVLPDDFANVFGDGISLRGVTTEIVDDPVKFEIPQILPWIESYKNVSLDGEQYTRPATLAGSLNYLDFYRPVPYSA